MLKPRDTSHCFGDLVRTFFPPPGLGWMHDNEVWHNSTAKGYEGWTWKGDTSSDETDGHMFAFAVVAALSYSWLGLDVDHWWW